MKWGFSSPPPSKNFKKLKSRSFFALRRDFQPSIFQQEGYGQQNTSMVSTSGSRMMRDLVCKRYGRNHRDDCWKEKGAYYSYGSLAHQIRDFPLKTDIISEQSMRGAQSTQQEARSEIVGKLGSV
ncbi:hypothetical protein J1N35_011779 [Gossypium stocksii]|uniref:Uncharacterized protein n=1 Tax=Gossypium stocksii TaxID=47602 RepID=A0A9D3W2Z7_9ROSI|nr:hypothetical protein J1N35_011779 [Gossypium stocksii]